MTITLKPIDQQVIVVFGASRGIGRTTALMAARQGARVVAAARDHEALESLVEEAAPGEVVAAVADAADLAQVRQVAEVAVEQWGHIDTGRMSRVSTCTRASRTSRPTSSAASSTST